MPRVACEFFAVTKTKVTSLITLPECWFALSFICARPTVETLHGTHPRMDTCVKQNQKKAPSSQTQSHELVQLPHACRLGLRVVRSYILSRLYVLFRPRSQKHGAFLYVVATHWAWVAWRYYNSYIYKKGNGMMDCLFGGHRCKAFSLADCLLIMPLKCAT